MATSVEMPELQSADRCKSRDAGNSQGRDASPNDDALMEHILENMRSTPWEEVLKRIACLPHIRRGKVLNIRHQITEGTYEIEDRLDGAIDAVLEAITCCSEEPCLDGDVRSGPAKLVAC
jgi:anti-sigma28 factor (negative regulator of flagellin synthesis)